MGRWHKFISSNPLTPINDTTLERIRNYLQTQRNEFRLDVNEYFNDNSYFSNNRIVLNSGILYDAEEPMEFNTNDRYRTYLYFKCGEGTYFEITFIILCILKEYYGEQVVYNTDVDKHFLLRPMSVLQSMGYTVTFKNRTYEEGGYWEQEEEIHVTLN